MIWTDTTLAQYARADLALPSDLTDAEQAVQEPFLPLPSHVRRPRTWPLRRFVEAIPYLLPSGLPWRTSPPSFFPASTVRRWLQLWRDDGLWLSLNHNLLLAGQEAVEREPFKRRGDLQPKRRILTDTDDNLAHAVTHAAGIQDRDATPIVLAGIINRSDMARGFEVLPRGWVVARTFAWFRRNRPLAKHFEQTIA